MEYKNGVKNGRIKIQRFVWSCSEDRKFKVKMIKINRKKGAMWGIKKFI